MHEQPYCAVADDDATLCQFSRQRRERDVGNFVDPVRDKRALSGQEHGPLAAHRFRRSIAGGLETLRPLHDTRHAYAESYGDGSARLAAFHGCNHTLAKIKGIRV